MKKALLQLHMAILLAGFTAILGRLITLGAVSLVWWRLVVTVVALYGILFFTKNKAPYSVALKKKVMAVGVVVGFHWLCFFSSVKLANVSVALVCLSASGFFSALIEPLVNRRRINFPELLLGMLSIAGIYIIFHFDTRYKLGICIGVLSALFSAIFPIFNKKLVSEIDGMSLTFYEMTGALIILSCLLPFYGYFGTTGFWPSGSDWLWLIILALLCTVWAFILQLKALHHISAFTLNLSYNLEPVYGIIIAFLLFHENQTLNFSFYLGTSFILLAVLLQMFMEKRRRHLQRALP